MHKLLEKRTSKEWIRKYYPTLLIMDPDGWDRENFEYSFGDEKIDLKEFINRVNQSTIQINTSVINQMAIDSERYYQGKLAQDPNRPDIIEDFHLGDALSAIQVNLDKARTEWYIGSGTHRGAMKYLRKIVAICKNQADNGKPFPFRNLNDL